MAEASDAFLVVDRVHYFGHAVALGLRCECLHQKGDCDGAKNGDEDDAGAPRRGRCVDIGVVVEGQLAEEQEIMEPADHGAEDHSPEARDHAHAQGA